MQITQQMRLLGLAVQCSDVCLEQTDSPANDVSLLIPFDCWQTLSVFIIWRMQAALFYLCSFCRLFVFFLHIYFPASPTVTFAGLFKVQVGEDTPAAPYYRMRQLTNVAVFTRELLLISQTMQGLMGRGLKRGHRRFLLFLQDTGRE